MGPSSVAKRTAQFISRILISVFISVTLMQQGYQCAAENDGLDIFLQKSFLYVFEFKTILKLRDLDDGPEYSEHLLMNQFLELRARTCDPETRRMEQLFYRRCHKRFIEWNKEL